MSKPKAHVTMITGGPVTQPTEPTGPVPAQSVIKTLEILLADARAGEIQSIAYVVGTPEGTGNGWQGMNRQNMAMLGELSVLHRDIMDLLITTRLNPETGEVDYVPE